jgi:Radical SAM superfamily/4Fe-4S single cluster domain
MVQSRDRLANSSISTIAILLTDDCPANCAFCSFKAHKHAKYLSSNVVEHWIGGLVAKCPAKVCVFTGGEPFVNIEVLTRAIEYATNLRLITRVVTNGYWASTKETAVGIAKKLALAGLKEVNISTGAYHSLWVPTEYVINAAAAFVELDITTLINVEQRWLGDDFNHDFIRLLSNETTPATMNKIRITLCEVVGLHFSQKRIVSFGAKSNGYFVPCRHLFSTITLLPNTEVSVCCGFAINHNNWLRFRTPSMASILEKFEEICSTPLLRYLKHIGPRKLFEERVLATHDGLVYDKECNHPCYYCYLLGKYLIDDSNVHSILDETELLQAALFEAVNE